jgi:cytochrome P450 / NADPH-cytochrome P450 reductase
LLFSKIVVAERKANPREVNDLLNVMLHSRDPDTGEKMSDELIRFEMMTFLLAGHDTTCEFLLLYTIDIN